MRLAPLFPQPGPAIQHPLLTSAREIFNTELGYVALLFGLFVIPNRQVIGDTLVNHSMYGATRVVVKIGIACKEKIEAARAVLVPVISQLNGVLKDPAPDVVARTMGDSSVNLEVRVWIDDPAIERPLGAQVVEVCKVALDAAGIEIPPLPAFAALPRERG